MAADTAFEGVKKTTNRGPVPREAVRKMAAYHPPTGGRRNKLRLDFNENTVGAPPHVIDFIQRYLTATDLTIYPEYEHTLEELAAHFKVPADEMTLTNGTDEAIHILLNTFVNEGDEVVLIEPAYAMYRFYSELAGAKIGELRYRPGNLAFPLAELVERVGPETRAILIGNPNNPTGTGTNLDGIRQILKAAPNAAVLIDEAYYEFCGITALPLVREFPNLFVSRTFSKTYGLAALRCGCLFSQSGNMAHVRKAQSPYSVNGLAAMAVRIAVQDRAFIEEYVLEILAAKELLYLGLEKLNISYVRTLANFVLFDAGERAIEIRDALRERSVLVRDRSYEISGAVRVTIGTREQVNKFLSELEKIW